MVKRTGAILLTMLYIVTVLGFALNFHICGDYVASVKIDAPAVNCGMDKANGKMKCCKDKQVEVKVKDAHQAEEATSFLAKVFGFELPHLSLDGLFPALPSSVSEKFYDRGPPDPPLQGIATFIRNCIFRI